MKIDKLSQKQKLTLKWWTKPEYSRYDAIICDGAVRSGKTLSMSLGFVSWAMTSFNGGYFAICGTPRRGVATDIV